MSIVSAFLVPGNPLPFLHPENPAWAGLATGAREAGRALAESKPDVILMYSTQWMAVLDQLWQTREHSTGVHVDENWYEFGDLQTDLRIDIPLALACIEASTRAGLRSKAIDYEGFPIDTGTIVANGFLNPGSKVNVVIGANNLYHDFAKTELLGKLAAEQAELQGKRVAVVGVGGLSGKFFDQKLDITTDHIRGETDDELNRKLLSLMEAGDIDGLRAWLPDYVAETGADMGMKHMAWILGATGVFSGAKTLAYGPTYGAGAAVVQFAV